MARQYYTRWSLAYDLNKIAQARERESTAREHIRRWKYAPLLADALKRAVEAAENPGKDYSWIGEAVEALKKWRENKP